MPNNDIRWRASGVYISTLSSKAGLIDETKIFLRIFSQTGDLTATCQALIEGALSQGSRQTRIAIVKVLRVRLVHWHPPAWVLHDLLTFADNTQSDAFAVALLLHVARQDLLLYEFIQRVVAPRWYEGIPSLIRSDVQSFLDQALEEHPEAARWSFSTRQKLSQHLLATLRDYTLCKGINTKSIVTPIVPNSVAYHLLRLLQAEGIPPAQLTVHPDWHLWLWEPEHVQSVLNSFELQEQR